MKFIWIIGLLTVLCGQYSYGQVPGNVGLIRNDTTPAVQQKHDTLPVLQKDTIKRKIYNPRTAAIRSAILPGLGQIYNRKYWKLPIVYGALGATAAVFLFNLREFNNVSFAYKVVLNKDTANWEKVAPSLKPFVQRNAAASLRNYRNQKRSDIDYSILVFAFAWALNVVDATVDAHLKGFDVNSDLSMKVKPLYNPGTRTTSLNLAFDLHKAKPRMLSLP